MKIRTKFLLTNFLITGLLGSAALWGVLCSTNLLEQEINAKYMAVSMYAMDKVHRLFSRRFEDLRILAREPAIQSPDSAPATVAGLLAAYKDHYKTYAPFAALALFDPDRRCIADSEGRRIGFRAPLSSYWKKMAGGADYALEISPSKQFDELAFNLARAVRDKRGRLTGVVVAQIPVDSLQTIAERPLKLLNLGVTPAMDLIDPTGQVLYSTHTPAGVMRKTWPGFGVIKYAIAAGEETGTRLFRAASQGAPKEILVFAREGRDANYRGNDWLLTITVPQRVALASMIELRNRLLLIIALIGCFSALIALLLSRAITRPIVRLSEAASAVGTGRLDVAVEVSSSDEAGNLAATFNGMVKRLDGLNCALQIAATVDKLTGVLNRNRIEQVLRDEMERSTRYGHPLSMILFDLDYFKRINDDHGHLAGDMVLKTVVAFVQQIIRTTDTLGRWGGEEFMLLAPESNLAQAVHLAEKVRQSIACCAIDGVGQITISCGVTEMRAGDREEDLIKRADDALYAAKRQGRNRVEDCQPA
jgi:diguanylate cyclase (GGDEF)-like protein